MLSNSSRSSENNVSCFRFPVFQTDNTPELIIVFNSTVNFPLSVLTIVGNTLVLVAVWRTPSLRSPSVILLCGLATTDLAVGLLVQHGSGIAWKLSSTVVFMNSALNPFIYCWRLREIRTAVKKSLFCRK